MSTLRGGDRAINWSELSAKLPSSKSRDDKIKRRKIFNDMDMNGNGYLSLAEVDKGVRDVLKADHLFDCKPAMLRAFNAVKDTAPAHTPHSDDYVTRAEFRLLMVCTLTSSHLITSPPSQHNNRLHCAKCLSCGICSSLWTLVTTAVWT